MVAGGIFWQMSSYGSPYTVEPAAFDSITEVVSETGNVTTAGATPIYSTTTGVIEEVYVANGSIVAKDEVLFKVKSTATKQEQEAALSTYMAAQNALEAAKATQLSLQAQMFDKWDTFKELAESDDYENNDGTPKNEQRALPEFHIPEKEWLSAEETYKNQERVISEKSVAASAAWRAYESTLDSAVSAVLGGEVRNLAVTRGDAITAPTATTMAGTAPVLILVDPSVRPSIKVDVNETDIIKIRQGQKVSVEFDAIDNRTFNALVDRVDSVASAQQDVITFSVYVSLVDDVPMINRGMTADVDITVAEKDTVLTVPSSAVKPYQGKKAVRVVGESGEVEYIPVEVGAQGDGKTEIIAGIEEGTEVIVAFPNDQVERSGGIF